MDASLFPDERIRLKNGKFGTRPQKMLEKATAMQYDYNRIMSINNGLTAQNRQLRVQIERLQTELSTLKKSS